MWHKSYEKMYLLQNILFNFHFFKQNFKSSLANCNMVPWEGLGWDVKNIPSRAAQPVIVYMEVPPPGVLHWFVYI